MRFPQILVAHSLTEFQYLHLTDQQVHLLLGCFVTLFKVRQQDQMWGKE
jgi:hypothetical protein